MEQIKFKNLNGWLKTAVIAAFIYIAEWIIYLFILE